MSRLTTAPFDLDMFGVGYRHNIIPFYDTPASVVGTWSRGCGSTQGPYFTNSTTKALNDAAVWNVLVPAGTYSVEFTYWKGTAAGTFTPAIDDGAGVFTDTGTAVDAYNGSSLYFQTTTHTGVVLATTVKRALRLKMTAKNASASAYELDISGIVLIRTA